MQNKPKKLVFVLPEYDENTSTHFAHTIDFIDEIAKDIDVFLFIEYAKGRPSLKNVDKIYCQKFPYPAVNLIERFIVLLWLRLKGYRNFYVHYSYWSGMIAGLIGKFYYWHCEAYQSYGSDRKWWDLKWKFFDDLPLKICLKLCDFLVTGTLSMAKFYADCFHVKESKIKIVPNSINLERIHANGIRKIAKQIVFVHWLAPRKGADLLPEIVDGCLAADSDLKFLIIGDGPLFKNLQNRFRDNISVKMTGALPNNDVIKHIAESDLLIMPSRQEGFPRVILESMALGTAFVATDVGGMKDIIPAEYKVVEPSHIELFSQRIVELVSDSNSRDEVVKSGLEKVKDFSTQNVAKIFKKII
ncbi:MAG: glycosyl transferase group 1 [uncultured bacterium]|nr:MAG: glycosyl transferase group 1 [uncultured bacterium]OGJ47067.1 MAG: hypothetical protein A2244_05005 [Candidatus Peregrinibacteria bacterium RIFOXYA2_FULL_41_18]OGJ49755.1 MAG: hypothetical protein A2344_03665 [Candidatus Peregrinibacteria bacterium RIFOXYB12_FULL_41_12]OGJ52644.1 MAG: hypothetical protein A2448_00245 [Candidatus Peregrinibacteria bacterium RIFOXYC2_FULL_41_22]OGJ54094.1 MAG: hypothetical protein A2336_03760 [Candidatus Peregrinibacteria bacterium RIFOXYB2_FULL_41_88]